MATRGLLIYRGYNVDDLAASSTYEEVAYLLLYGELPTPFQLDEFRTALLRQMNLPEPVDEFLRRLPPDAPPMAALEAAVAFASLYDTEGDSLPATSRKAVRLVARVPSDRGCRLPACGEARTRFRRMDRCRWRPISCGCSPAGCRRRTKPM